MTKRILIVPLDWGLGHATRCIPVIRLLLQKDCEVLIGGYGASLSLLKNEFPQCVFFEFPGYSPQYPRRGSMVAKMIRQIPHFWMTIRKEYSLLQKLIEEHKIHMVISDNRYGCWSRKAYSVFITHQSNILMPKRFGWLASTVRLVNERLMKKFDVCWVPDYPADGNLLSGELVSFGKRAFHKNIRWTGPLSRFTFRSSNEEIKYDVVAICSGPEPQRSVFESILTQNFAGSALRFLLVRGLIVHGPMERLGNGYVVNFLGSDDLQEVLLRAGVVIARSGYSTVMDLQTLGKKAVFVPTPGQTEQEYLAKSLMEKGVAYCMKQKDFDLGRALSEIKNFSGFNREEAVNYLDEVVNELIDHESISC